jgi:hypothetical protein
LPRLCLVHLALESHQLQSKALKPDRSPGARTGSPAAGRGSPEAREESATRDSN